MSKGNKTKQRAKKEIKQCRGHSVTLALAIKGDIIEMAVLCEDLKDVNTRPTGYTNRCLQGGRVSAHLRRTLLGVLVSAKEVNGERGSCDQERGEMPPRLGRSPDRCEGLGFTPRKATAGLHADGAMCPVSCFCRSVQTMLQGRLMQMHAGGSCEDPPQSSQGEMAQSDLGWSGGGGRVWCSNLVIHRMNRWLSPAYAG